MGFGMKTRLAGIALALVAVFATGAATTAQPARQPLRADVFTIHGVEVDVTARNAAIARTLAIRNGERRAFARLMERLVRDDDAARLSALDQARITDLVLGLQFANERSSQVRYIADLTVRFSGDKIRKFLKESEVAFTQTQGTPLVVIPVMEYAGSRLLWEDDNLWRTAWAGQDIANSLLPYVLPEGTVRDQLTLSQFQALGRDPGQRRILANIYGAQGAFVPLATVTPDFRDGGTKVTVTWVYDDMAIAEQSEGAGPRTQVFHGKTGEPLEETLNRAAAGVIAERDRIWKERTLIRLDETRSLTARVPLRSMSDWAEVQRRLEEVNLVQSVTLNALKLGEAEVHLSYAGRADQLVLALSQHGLVLRSHEGDVYLMPGDIAAERDIKPEFDFVPPGEEAVDIVPPDTVDAFGNSKEGPVDPR